MAGLSLSKRPSHYALTALMASLLSVSVGISAYSEDTLPSTSAQDAFPLEVSPSQLPTLDANSANPDEAASVKAKAVVVDILSDTLDYDTAKNTYTATGNVKVVVSEQNTELWGDKVLYDPAKEVMTAFGNVVINNKGQKVYGTYAKIDLTRQSALINDPITALDEVRIKARQAFVDGKVSRMFNGKLVMLPRQQIVDPAANIWGGESDADFSKLAIEDPLMGPQKKAQATYTAGSNVAPGTVDASKYPNTLVPQDLDMNWDSDHTGISNDMQYYAKHVDVIQGEDDYDEINAISPVLKYKNIPIARLPQMDFANIGPSSDLEYLGPDIGIDPDFGGLYAGPGYDFRLGRGYVRMSPVLSYGVGKRRFRSGQDLKQVRGVGAGLMAHYMSHEMNIQGGYNAQVRTPTFMLKRKMFGDSKSLLLLTANEDYTTGYLGYERPRYSAQLTDKRQLFIEPLQAHNMMLGTYATAGAAYDEFFPTNQKDYFVEKPTSKPVTEGRIQLQAQFRNAKPVWSIGDKTANSLGLGWNVQGSAAAYSTADYFTLIRFGPTSQVRLFGDRFSSINRYYHAFMSGDSPFVFDKYTAGKNVIQSNNKIRINKYLTVGMRTQASLSQDNAKGSLFTGNALYALFGPEDVKFNIAYDFIRQRSFFGINLMQGKAYKTLHYERMDIYQPQDYDGPPPMTSAAPTLANPATDVFGNVNDVGMMNGNAAR